MRVLFRLRNKANKVLAISFSRHAMVILQRCFRFSHVEAVRLTREEHRHCLGCAFDLPIEDEPPDAHQGAEPEPPAPEPLSTDRASEGAFSGSAGQPDSP